MAPSKHKSLCRDLVGRYAKLTRRIETRGGVVLPEGQRVLVQSTYRGRFYVVGVGPQGDAPVCDKKDRPMHCSGVERGALQMEEKAEPQGLTESEWRAVFRIRCQTKQGRAITSEEQALMQRAFSADKKRYAAMNADVFNETVRPRE